MNRIIKFRAWGKENKHMYYDLELGLYHKNTGNFFSKIGEALKTADLDEVELMQYTGLKDSKGNEIYEGDIIGYWYKAFWIVTWIDYRWRLSGGEGWNGSFALSPSVMKTKEIIGNIYENPDLLTPTHNT